jgi:YggT family protein
MRRVVAVLAVGLVSCTSALKLSDGSRARRVLPSAGALRVHGAAVAATTLTAALLGFGDTAQAVASADPQALQVARPVIDIFVNSLSLLFLVRTVLSWYPKTNLNEFPYNIAAWPTEPLLVPVRSLIPPAFGVDVSSIVWIMLLSFFREILTGQQGILTLLERQ